MPGTRLPLARQSVVEADGRRVGFELLFRGVGAAPGSSGWDAAAADRATSVVISEAFGGFTPGTLGEGGLLFVNLTRSFLVGDVPLPLGPDGVVLEVLEDVPVDAALLEGLARLRAEGYLLALDDYVGDAERLALVPFVDVVKVDLEATRAAGRTAAEVASLCWEASPGVRLLAERVETADDVAECSAAGYTWFQGFFFDRPLTVSGVALSPSQVVCARLLALLGKGDASPREVEALVREDPALGLRVLRWAGSAGSGTRAPVRSVGQALVLLGPRVLTSWVVLALVGTSGARSADDLVRVLPRARACELLAPEPACEDELYTAGLLSAVADVTGTPVEHLVRDVRVGEVVAEALLRGTGRAGRVLSAVRELEGDLTPGGVEVGDGVHGPGAAQVVAAHLAAMAAATLTARSLVAVA